MTPERQALLLGAATLVLVVLGLWERWRHRRNLRRLPTRIHVNGTRGKSSVTRLIAAGLRAGGIRTLGKITGTTPLLLTPEGEERKLERRGRANIIEQLGVVATAVELQCEALVIECMALNPHLQWLSEARMVEATMAVITNARADHLDVMGPEEVDVAWALASMIPVQRPVLTAERDHAAVFGTVAEDRQSELVVIDAKTASQVSADELGRFRYIEHRDNVALALEACGRLGVAREVALEGMTALDPGPGSAVSLEWMGKGRRVVFVNAFAANDPESTEQLWNLARERHPELTDTVALFNCRADRTDRSRQLAEALTGWESASHVGLIGTGRRAFLRYLGEAVATPRELGREGDDVALIWEALLQLSEGDMLVVGMGNIGGPGLALVRYLKQRVGTAGQEAA